jgi:hypothetical protein
MSQCDGFVANRDLKQIGVESMPFHVFSVSDRPSHKSRFDGLSQGIAYVQGKLRIRIAYFGNDLRRIFTSSLQEF